jgi:hypothetical protein
MKFDGRLRKLHGLVMAVVREQLIGDLLTIKGN